MTSKSIISVLIIVSLCVGLLVYLALRSEKKPAREVAIKSSKVAGITFAVTATLIIIGIAAVYMWVLYAISHSEDFN